MQRAIITLQRIICHYGNLCSVQTQLKILFDLKLIESYRQRRLKQHSGCPPCFKSALRLLSLSPPLSLHLFKWKSSEGRLSLPLTSVEKHWWPSRPFTTLTTHLDGRSGSFPDSQPSMLLSKLSEGLSTLNNKQEFVLKKLEGTILAPVF